MQEIEPEAPAIVPSIDVMAMNPAAVAADSTLTAMALEVMSAKLEDAQRRKKAVEVQIADLNAKNEWLKRVQARQPVPKQPPPFVAIHEQMRRDSPDRAERGSLIKSLRGQDVRKILRAGANRDEASLRALHRAANA